MSEISSTIEKTSLTKMIESFRLCKTSSEEREFIYRERAQIRNHIREQNQVDKAESILKLIWMNMLGYETEFSQIECMSSLFSDNLRFKLVGYLGLTLFLSEESQVLMLATNRLRIDMESKGDDFVPALALRAFSEIADSSMAKDLSGSVKSLLKSDSKFVRKKAVLACFRILRKLPSFVEELYDILPSLLNDPNQGLLLCVIHLAKSAIRLRPSLSSLLHPCFQNLQAVARQLTSKISSHYHISGVNDPFLQCAILDLLGEMGKHDEQSRQEFGQIALLLHNSLQGNNSGTAKCIEYQIAKSVLAMPAPATLRKVAVSILGSFLDMRNKNYLYSSLLMLGLAAKQSREEVAKYERVLSRCARERDFTIKKLALQVLADVAEASSCEAVLRQVLVQAFMEAEAAKKNALHDLAF